MKNGRSLSLLAVGATGLTSAGAATLVALAGGVDVAAHTWALAAGAAGAVIAGAVLLPLGWLLDRDLGRLIAELEHLRTSEKPEPIGTGGPLAQLRQAVQDTIGALGERVESTAGKLREVEIRHHVSEAERQHAEAILHSLHDAVLVTDAFNELKMANERAGELLGFDLAASLHRPIDQIIPDEVLRKLICEERDVATPGHRKHVDYFLEQDGGSGPSRPPGEVQPCYDVTLTCLPDGKRSVGGVVTILRDVTREREISQMKSDFVSKVSHELRTPLSSINAYVELLVDGEARDEESRKEFYLVIKNEADRLGRLIDNMLNISRIEAGIVKIDRTEVDFIKAARAAIEVIQPQAKLKNINVHLKSSPLACTAMADADMVQQVLLNLLSNAVKYTPEGGRVTLTVENDDATRSAMVTVADTGLGIPPDAMPRMFEKFYRIENYKRVAKGTGLGLALVKHIVETVHHGHIGVTSELGMGSKFTFTIPYDYEAA